MGFYALPPRLLLIAPTLDYSEYAGYRPIFDSIFDSIYTTIYPHTHTALQIRLRAPGVGLRFKQ